MEEMKKIVEGIGGNGNDPGEKWDGAAYFAYGSNMDEAQMEVRCPGATFVQKAEVKGYRFELDESGVATIVPDASNHVEGLLWSVTREDIEGLDRYEGVALDCYRKAWIDVASGSGEMVRALVYLSNRSLGHGNGRSGYMEKIVQAAKDHGFSQAYVDMLNAFLEE